MLTSTDIDAPTSWPCRCLFAILPLSGTNYPTDSRFVFFNAAGTKLYVVSDAAGAPTTTSSILTELVP